MIFLLCKKTNVIGSSLSFFLLFKYIPQLFYYQWPIVCANTACNTYRQLLSYNNSHVVKFGAVFSLEVDNQLLQAAKLLSSPKYHAIVAILIDEMTIKEDLCMTSTVVD